MAELQVRDSLGGEPAWVEEGAAATGAGGTSGVFSVSAISHGVPGGAWFRIDLAGGLVLLADEREERWAGEGQTCVWRVGVDPSAAPAKSHYEVRLSGPEGPLAKAGREVALGHREAAAVLVALNAVFQVAFYSVLGYFYLQLLPGWLGLETDALDLRKPADHRQ